MILRLFILALLVSVPSYGFIRTGFRSRFMPVACAGNDNVDLFAAPVKLPKSPSSSEKSNNSNGKEFSRTTKVSVDTDAIDKTTNPPQSTAEPGMDNRDPAMADHEDAMPSTIETPKSGEDNISRFSGSAPTEDTPSSAGTTSASSPTPSYPKPLSPSSSLESASLPAMKAFDKMKKDKPAESFGERMAAASQRAELLKLESQRDKLDAQLISLDKTLEELDANDRVLELLIKEEITVDDMVNPEKEIEGVSTVDMRMLVRIGELTTYAETADTQKFFGELLEELMTREELQEVREQLAKYMDGYKMIP